MSQTRRLAAILAADVAGYSRLMGADEEGTLERLKALRRELVDPKIAEHKGRLVKTTGDGLLVEFGSVVDALRCAVEVQREMGGRNAGVPPDNHIELRIGINMGDIVVEEDAAGKLDLVFEDIGEQQLKNIARPVRAYRVVTEARPAMPQASAGPPLPDKPSIAVLPFQNMSGDPEQEYFADGMVEEIITALSRIRWLFVIARNSSFTYKGQVVDVKLVGRELGVRYVLEGSVRKAGGRVRITAQLIDARNGAHLWADRFDGSLEDVFDLQDKVAVSVAGVIEPALQAAETARSANRPTNDLTAYDLYLRAYATFFSAAPIPEALRLFDQAIDHDPHYGPALAWAALCRGRLLEDGRNEEPEADTRRAADLARRALQVAGDDPGVLANSALVLASLGDDIGAMTTLVDRALALNPSFARGWYIRGFLKLWAGQLDAAIEHVEASLRLSPRARIGSPLVVIGIAQFLSRHFDEASATLLVAVQDNPAFPMPRRALAACYAHMGRIDEAREVVRGLRASTAVVVPSIIPFRSPEHRELLLSGLRLAMGEET